MKFSGVMFGSENPKQLGEFYTKVFGTPTWNKDDWYGFNVGGGNLAIGPHSEVKGTNQTPGRIMLVIESENVPGDFKDIQAHGAKVIAEPYQPNSTESPDTWLATFADPDGNYFQLATPWK